MYEVKEGGAQPIDDVIVLARSDYQMAAALRFEIHVKFLSWLFSFLRWVLSLSLS